ncbi:O-antigen ligase [Halobacillus sp. Marseille-Q1614]|uniref:O-antigen ligase family protein n=1 Tax=Halobacillus sp. Marseille-Q1614 TaxID=2709134 RepID=UPI001571277A|nr:O-antigen ligase family protein [Halobacillus sp. Marseille-Q1614]
MGHPDASAVPRSSLILFLLLFSVMLGKYHIYIGFAFKPYMMYLGILVVVLAASFRFQKLQGFEVMLLFFYLVYVFSGAFSLYASSSLRVMLGIFLYVTFYIIMKGILQMFQKSELENGLANAGLLFNVGSLFLYVWGIKSNGFSLLGDGVIRYGVWFDRDYPRLIGLIEDPNYFVFYNTIFFTFYLCNRDSRKNKIGLLLCLITSVLTFSRGGLLILMVIFMVYFFLNKPANQWRLFLSTSFFLGLIVMVGQAMSFRVMDILQNRFEDFSNDGGSGRFELWGRAWEFFLSNPLFGIGASNFADYNAFHYGDDLVVHNTFLEVLTESGIIGLFVYGLFVFTVLYQIFQAKFHQKHPFLFLTFLGCMFQMMFLSLIVNDMFLLFLAVLSTYFSYERETGKDKENPLIVKEAG